MEDPLLSCLFNILKVFKGEIEKAKRIIHPSGEDILVLIEKDLTGKNDKPELNLGKDYEDAKNLYISAQMFVTFLLDHNQESTSTSLLEKLQSKESLKFFLTPTHRRAFKIPVSTTSSERPELKKCLYIIPYSKLNL